MLLAKRDNAERLIPIIGEIDHEFSRPFSAMDDAPILPNVFALHHRTLSLGIGSPHSPQ